MHHDTSPIGVLGFIAVILFGLIRSAFSKGMPAKPATLLKPQQPPRPPPSRTSPVAATQPRPVVLPVLAPPVVPDEGLGAWVAQWKKCLYSTVKGVSFNNQDGSSRQEIVRKCQVGEILLLLRDPDNPYSATGTTIKVVRQTGEIVGHVQSEISQILADQMDRGAHAEARVTMLTGGTPGRATLGVNIIIGQNYAPRRKRVKTVEQESV